MNKRNPKRKIVKRRIAKLKPHPQQAATFGHLRGIDLRSLADNIEEEGLLNPIEITSDGTIISGHQRVRAYELLGREEIDCWVRDDLEKQGESAIACRFVEANSIGRQLTILDSARGVLVLWGANLNDALNRVEYLPELINYIAERFNFSRKQAERYAKMVFAPPSIQHAFDEGMLTQQQVLKVVALAEDVRLQIAQQIEDGVSPKDVVGPYISDELNMPIKVETLVVRLVKTLVRIERQLRPRMDEIPGRRLSHCLPILLNGETFLQHVYAELEKKIEAEELAEEEDIDYGF